jgi:hypothetical protein
LISTILVVARIIEQVFYKKIILEKIFLLGQHLSYPSCQNVAQERLIMTTMNAIDKQLELGFNGIQPRANAARREGRIARANWWFTQMRDIVERAMDWQAAGQPRPEQIWIPSASREVKI